MSLSFETVDAFTNKKFTGNPASVIVLPPNSNHKEEELQQIAFEFNLSETAFCLIKSDSTDVNPHFGLRWFTPAVEVTLCGHATLASSFVLFKSYPLASTITFETLSGPLLAMKQSNGKIALDFPADHSTLLLITEGEKYEKVLKEAIEAAPEVKGKILGIAFSSEKVGMGPVVELEGSLDLEGLVVDTTKFSVMTFTQAAPSSSPFGIHSRFFGPGLGIAEDPVTGSLHCYLAPYWLGTTAFSRLNQGFTKTTLRARQVSKRGGEMDLEWNGEKGRVRLLGEAVTVMKGTIL